MIVDGFQRVYSIIFQFYVLDSAIAAPIDLAQIYIFQFYVLDSFGASGVLIAWAITFNSMY